MVFLSTLLVSILAFLGGQGSAEWADTWARLDQLKGLEKGTQGAQELLLELKKAEGDAQLGLRRSILELQLRRWEGEDVHLSPEGVDSSELSGHENWLLAEVLPTSPQRAQAVLAGLRQTETLDTQERDLAWQTAAAEAGALRFAEGALPIQRILHERYQAVWTTMHLALTLMRLGELGELGRLMQKTIDQEAEAGRPTAELWSQWGLALLGAGNEQRARNYLGRALSYGSNNAALILGHLDLQQGRLLPARAGFRASLQTEQPAAWALRGWGATLLPEALTNPAGSQPSATQD